MENYPTDSLPLPKVNYRYKDHDNIIRSENSPIQTQKRTRHFGSDVPVIFTFTAFQLSIWESWVYNFLNDGIDWFSMPLLMGPGLFDCTVRIKGKYSVQDIGPDAYNVPVTLEMDQKTASVSIDWINEFHTLVHITMPTELGGSGWI